MNDASRSACASTCQWPAAGGGGAVVARQARRHRADVRVEPWLQRGGVDIRVGERLRDALALRLQRRRAGHRVVDEAVELRVAERGPPARRDRLRAAGGGPDRVTRVELLDGRDPCRRALRTERRAARDGQRRDCRNQAPDAARRIEEKGHGRFPVSRWSLESI
ncbi:hypothetical protein [Burkholderia sp. F1]|uniref:hypothetical protein n=1 Tax=Burkholderia sp. F1 TaxID=3366817 RepID=UPI003D7186C0